MIDLVHVGQIIVGVHAMLGHHAAHAGAVAAVIVLLDHAGFFRGDFEIRADELADPRVDLLPQIDVVRVQRVVEIEHPGVDMREGAGKVIASSSLSCPRRRGIQYAAAIEISNSASRSSWITRLAGALTRKTG